MTNATIAVFCFVLVSMVAFLVVSLEREADARGRYFVECMERFDWIPEKTGACRELAYYRARVGAE